MTVNGRIDAEIDNAVDTCQKLIAAYVAFGDEFKVGESYNVMYGEILDFVNFRIESADTCLSLIEQRKIADSLGLSRSILENYLLLKLICQGTKFFQLQTFENLTEGQFKAKLRQIQTRVEAERAAGETACIDIRAYPRARRHIMYVFEGLKDKELPGFTIPIHYFQFKEFQPETMRLKDENYFVYYEDPEDLKKARKAQEQEETFRYRHYLSYDALLECLSLNGLSDKAIQARIDAHYTFLGKFLHPTYEAARELHERSNFHDGKPGVGMQQEYTKAAVLLAALYVCHMLADVLDEVSLLFESAPATYISEPGTSAMRESARDARDRFPYFWFIYNEPSLYDKFVYAIHHVSEEDLAEHGGYMGIPAEHIPFNQHIYGQLESALNGWSNTKCGVYRSPLS